MVYEILYHMSCDFSTLKTAKASTDTLVEAFAVQLVFLQVTSI